MLVSGYDETGAHLYEFQPSGSVLEYYGAAIGARSQAARTYLERNLDTIRESDTVELLIVHGLNALRDTLSQDVELTFKNTSVSVVGKDIDFTIYDDEDVQQWLDKLDSVSNARNREEDDGADEEVAEETAATDEAVTSTTGTGAASTDAASGNDAPAPSTDDRMETDE